MFTQFTANLPRSIDVNQMHEVPFLKGQKTTKELIDSLLYSYHLSRNSTLPIISTMNHASVCLKRLEFKRGETYSKMSFDSRFELMKQVSKKVIITYPLGLNIIHQWFLNGFPDESFSENDDGQFRMRSIDFYSFVTAAEEAELCVLFNSSPKDNYVIGRFRQHFGGDCILNVSFTFSRMGLRSQRMLRDQMSSDEKIEATFNKVESQLFFSMTKKRILKEDTTLLDQVFDREYVQKIKHKARLRNEIITWQKAFENDNINPKSFTFGKYTFSVLCQNTSGMHSYKYVYCCPALAKVKDSITMDQIKEWAIPMDYNTDLYDPKKILKQRIRLSLYNTPVIPTEDILDYKVIEDCIENGFNFTDGCGFISVEMARKVYGHIVKKSNVKPPPCDRDEDDNYDEVRGFYEFSNSEYIPSAFQIRFRGAKGMLVVNKDTFKLYGCHVVLRESMVKCKMVDNVDITLTMLQIVGHSSPCEFSRMNSTIMHILSGCDANGSVSERIEELTVEHANNVLKKYVNQDIEKVAQEYIKENDLVSLNVLSSTHRTDYAFLTGPYKKLITSLKIPFSNSRRLYGVVDPYGVLKEDEVFVQLSNFDNPNKKKILEGYIVITKEPCLHRGDLRKLKAVNRPELADTLYDVIVFPRSGKRPISNMISGSDLDGDQYFVCWDDKIVSNVRIYEPGIFDEEMQQEDIRPFEPDVFKDWVGVRHAFVDRYGSKWTEDEYWNKTTNRLCEIVNRAVDSPKHGIISVVTRKNDLQFIDEFPGYPHYHQTKRGPLLKSRSLVSTVFKKMVNLVTENLGLKQHNTKISTQDDKEHILESIRLEILELLLSKPVLFGESLMNTYCNYIDRVLKTEQRAQFLSEFFNLMHGFLVLKTDKIYICKILSTLPNLSANASTQLLELLESNNDILFSSAISKRQFESRGLIPKKTHGDGTCILYEIDSKSIEHKFKTFLLQEIFCQAQEGMQLELGINSLFGKSLVTVLAQAEQISEHVLTNPSHYFEFGKSLFENSNKVVGVKLIQAAQGENYPPAFTFLGNLYEHGNYFSKDLNRALKLYHEAANLNYAEAFGLLGDFHCFTIDESEKAVLYYEKAAELGYVHAMTRLAHIYFENGDLVKSFEYDLKAAGLGDGNSIKNVALAYLYGEGVEQDENRFIEWISKSISLGRSDSMTLFADFHVGCFNHSAAASYYKMAENLGDNEAKLKLGVLYLCGLGVEQDTTLGDELIQESGQADRLNEIVSFMLHNYQLNTL